MGLEKYADLDMFPIACINMCLLSTNVGQVFILDRIVLLLIMNSLHFLMNKAVLFFFSLLWVI